MELRQVIPYLMLYEALYYQGNEVAKQGTFDISNILQQDRSNTVYWLKLLMPIMYDGQPIFCRHVSFSMDDLELHGYFYHDVRRESDERADLHRNIMERRKRIESLQVRRGIKKSIESIAGSYMRYITYRIENNLVVTSARDNAVSAAENRMGRFLLAYRHRDAIDKVFHVLKTDIDIFPRRCVLSVFRNACLSYLYTWCLYPLLPGRNWTYPYKRPQSQTHP